MIRSRILLPAALAAAVTGAACAPGTPVRTAPPPPAASVFPADEDLSVMLRYLVEDGEAPGVILGIVEADGSTRILQHGTAGPGARPLSPQTVFEIGSINKTFTGTILAGMVAKGEVALDDPVAKYLPQGVTVPSRGGRQITLLDLVTHRSGLPRLPDNHRPADQANPYADYTVATMYEFLSGHELRRDIGAEFEYSNLGMGLLGHALARAAGIPFTQLVEQRILDPLGMEMTSYDREGELAPWLAKGHDEAGQVVSYWDPTEAIAGAGGLRSSMEDMLVYLRAQLGPADTDLERAMRVAQQVHHAYPTFGAGLAWPVQTLDGRTVISHTGGTGGFNTAIGFDPERRTGFVMLTNSSGFNDDLPLDFLRRGAPLAIPEVQVAADVLRPYAGEYEMRPGQSAFVRLEDDGTMTLRVPGNVRFRMYAESDSTFFLKRAPWRISFTKDAAGRVAALRMDMDGTEHTLRRISDRAPLPGAEVRDLPLSPDEMARYVGTYTLQMGGQALEVRVFVHEGRLMGQAAGQPRSPLRYQGGHVFIPEFSDEVRLVFAVGADGRATGLTLHQGGREIPGTRTP